MRKVLLSIFILFTKLSSAQVNSNSTLVAPSPFNVNAGKSTNDTGGINLKNYSLQNVSIGFTAPDTVCINSPVNIENTSQGAFNYYWNFCTANINQPPLGTNLGNVGNLLSQPVYMDYVFTKGNYYGFITNNSPGGLLRLDFGNSLLNIPVVTSLGNLGGEIPNNTEGVQIANDNGNWYVLIVGGDIMNGVIPSLTTVSLGTDIANNAPTATNWGNIGNLSYPHDLYVFNDNNHWYGLTVNYSNNTVTLFDLTTSLSNTPSAVNLGNIGNLSGPTGIQALNDNGNWHIFVTNATSSTLTRLDFGSSLLNIPTGVNLGNPNNAFVTCWDIYILKYCGENEAYVINADGINDIIKLDFGNSLLNTPTAQSLGNQGNLDFPHSISKLFRVGPNVFSFVTNVKNNTLTLLEFAGCTNASIPNSTAKNPPSIAYNTPGTYNINLTVDEGLPTQSSFCKQVVVQKCDKIINDYTPVIAFNPCNNSLTVEDAGKYYPGDTVLIIQMKGAVIDSTNTVNFGKVADYKNAGNYEFNYVKQKTGNIIELKNVITRKYDVPEGRVQLVRVPYYITADINTTLTCVPWDGSKGGVFALNVQDNLNLNADIDVSGKGFLGGNSQNPHTTVTYCFNDQYHYKKGDQSAAEKGGSISAIGDNIAWGKGSPANGGGGGNGHNSGGGGGSNGGSGGFGGYQLDVCGNAPFDNRGIGGKPLVYNNASNKIYLGGGGGSGHTDNGGGSDMPGGNGGGIIIINSPVINPNGFQIKANGSNAYECNLNPIELCHDGSGGGGAGGTILIQTTNVSSSGNIDVSGGKGGNLVIYNGVGATKIGPGGGGGAGTVWFNTPALPVNFVINKTGGQNGVILQNNNDPWGATKGQDGLNVFNLKIPVDAVPFKKNIDSVRSRDSAYNCSSYDFKGLAYLQTSPINKWEWNFGDGGTSVTKNANHTYALAGSFNVKLIVTDANGCKDSTSKVVTTSIVKITKSKDTSICGSLPVQLTASGGTEYSWTPSSSINNPNVANPIATPLNTTIYYVDVSNAAGCSKKDSIRITVNAFPVVTKSNDTTICSNTFAKLFANGGANYTWTPTSSLNNPNIYNPVAFPLITTKYYVTAKAEGGCFKKDSVIITVRPKPLITKAKDTAICTNTSVQIFANGGVSYTWSPSSSLSNSNIANPVAKPSATTVYHVTITDANSCNYADSIKVGIRPTPVFTISSDQTVCSKNSKQLFASGGNSYLWQPASFLNNPNIPNPIANPLSTTIFNVKIKDNICNDSVVLNTTLTVVSSPVVNASKANDIDCSTISSQLNASGALNYEWSPVENLSNSTIANPIATPKTNTLYTVKGTDINGCLNTDTVTVKVGLNADLFYAMPNSFTPNDDNLNDCYGLKYWGIVEQLDFSIYNRFGEKVFYTSNPSVCWDGKYKGRLQDANAFVYMISAKTGCGKIEKKGYFLLIR